MGNFQCLPTISFWIAVMFNMVYGFYVQPTSLKFESHPQSQIAVENSTIFFKCSVNKTSFDSYLPNPYVTWFHGNSSTSCTNTSLEDQGSLIVSKCTIESVQITDIGWYHCQVVDGTNTTFCQNLPCVKTVTSSGSAYLQLIGHKSFNSMQYLSSNGQSSTVLKCFELNHMLTAYSFANFDIVWSKDNQIIQSSTEVFKILPSKNLLLLSNSSTMEEVVGTYQCQAVLHNNSNGVLITHIELLPSSQNYNSPSLSLISSPSSAYSNGVHSIQSAPLELICLYNGVSPYDITWTYNSINIQNMTGPLLANNSFTSGEYCCNVGMISSCINLNVLSIESPPHTVTIFIDGNSSTPQLNCTSTAFPVYWVHNGLHIAHNSLTFALTSNSLVAKYGTYQCFIANSSLDALVVYRVLPYGWTNPISSVLPVAHPLPSDNFSLTWKLPTYTGGLNSSKLLVRVVTKYREVFPVHYTTTTVSNTQPTYYRDGDYWFEVTVIDIDGTNISETAQTLRFNTCSLFSPLPPVINISCNKQSALLHWERSSLEPHLGFVDVYLHLECYNNGEKVSDELSSALYWQNPHDVSVTQNMSDNGFCNFTGYGSRIACVGSTTSSGTCFAAGPSSTQIAIATPTSSDTTTTIVIKESSSVSIVTTPPPTSNNSSYLGPVTYVEPLPTIEIPTEPVLTNTAIVIIATSLSFVLILLALTVLCLVSGKVWRMNKARKSIIITPSSIIVEPTIAVDLYFMSDDDLTLKGDGDSYSIITQYNTPFWKEDTLSDSEAPSPPEISNVEQKKLNTDSDDGTKNITAASESASNPVKTGTTTNSQSTCNSSSSISSSHHTDVSSGSLDSGFMPEYLQNFDYHSNMSKTSFEIHEVTDSTIDEEAAQDVVVVLEPGSSKMVCMKGHDEMTETDSCHSYV